MSEWTYKINLGRSFDPIDGSFSEHRDRVVAVIRNSAWQRGSQYSSDLTDLVERLADTAYIAEFDDVLDEIYDLADDDCCWIETALW